MNHQHNPDLCNIIIKDGQQYLTMPSGEIIPAQVWTRVTDHCNERPYVIVKVIVNLKSDANP